MGILKKKNGEPSKFAKILGGVGKVAGLAASVAPLPGAGALGKVVGKLSDKVGKLSGGKLSLDVLKPREKETALDYGQRLVKGAGGGIQGFVDQADTNYNGNNLLGLSPVESGVANERIKNYLVIGGAIVGGVLLLKALKVF